MEGYTLPDMDPQMVPSVGEGTPMPVDPSQASMDPNVALAEAQQQIAQLQGQLQAMGGQLLHSHQVLLAQVPRDPSGVPARIAPNPAGRAALKPSTPQPFSGTGQSKDSVSSFVFQLNHYFTLLNVSDDESRIAYAVTLLQGAALTWYRSLSRLQQAPTTWADFVAALEAQFQPINASKLARDRIATLRQIASVRDYIHHFKTLALEIQPPMSAQETLDRFIRGLKPLTRRELELRSVSDFETACTIAERQDALSWKYLGNPKGPTRQPLRPTYSAVTRAAPVPMEIGTLQHTKALPRPTLPKPRPHTLTPGTPRPDLPPRRCYCCQQLGHIAANCPQRQHAALRPGVAPNRFPAAIRPTVQK